jgi:glycosyltransferase involved in cell wall biosynthesis
VTIIASSFHYAKYQEMKEYGSAEYLVEKIDGVDFVWFKTPPYRGNSFARVRNMLSFSYKVLQYIPTLNLQKPDIIIGSSVHLFAVYSAYKLSQRYKTPFIMEVRDLWPQTLIDMGISKWHPFILLLSWLEKYLYKRAQKIITTLPHANNYINQFVEDTKIVWISNGATLKDGAPLIAKLDTKKFNVVYAGAHGVANDLELLVDSAKLLQENDFIHFTLIGDGALKGQLIQKSQELGLQNITFLDSVVKEQVVDYLKSADLLYVGLKDLPLYKYGMSMNKVYEYMSAKKPLLFVSAMEDNLIKEANAGEVVTSYKAEDIAKVIENFSKMPHDKLCAYGQNGFDYMKKNYTIKVLVDKFEQILMEEVHVNG